MRNFWVILIWVWNHFDWLDMVVWSPMTISFVYMMQWQLSDSGLIGSWFGSLVMADLTD